MSLVRIDVIEGRSNADIAAISDAVHQGLVSVVGIPDGAPELAARGRESPFPSPSPDATP